MSAKILWALKNRQNFYTYIFHSNNINLIINFVKLHRFVFLCFELGTSTEVFSDKNTTLCSFKIPVKVT